MDFSKSKDDCIFAGFIVVFGLLCRIVYYQVKDDGRLKQIIDKYEESCGEQSNSCFKQKPQ